jgi:hypothetical protein
VRIFTSAAYDQHVSTFYRTDAGSLSTGRLGGFQQAQTT